MKRISVTWTEIVKQTAVFEVPDEFDPNGLPSDEAYGDDEAVRELVCEKEGDSQEYAVTEREVDGWEWVE